MTLDEVNDYLVEQKGIPEAEAYEIAIDLMGKSMDEVDAYLDRRTEVNLTGQPVGQPTDNTQVDQGNLTGQPVGQPVGQPEPFNIRMSVKVNKSLSDEIQRQAEELNMSVSALIRSVLQGYFK